MDILFTEMTYNYLQLFYLAHSWYECRKPLFINPNRSNWNYLNIVITICLERYSL